MSQRIYIAKPFPFPKELTVTAPSSPLPVRKRKYETKKDIVPNSKPLATSR